MKSLLRAFVASIVVIAAVSTPAQLQTDRAKRSEEILIKMRQLDILNHLVPVLMSKDQINKLLIPVEKAREKVKQIQDMEASDLAKFESKINDAIDKGLNKDLVPSKPLMVELAKLMQAFAIRRDIARGENADLVLAVMKKELNEGQLKAAMNSHDLKAYDPRLDVSKLGDDDKLKFYIKDILLDPYAYDILIKLSKKAS